MYERLFNVERAENAWNKLSEKYSHRYHETFSAWSRLSHSMRHNYSQNYDGGLLRVIAFFGESFPEILTEDSVIFQAGPMTASLSADPHSNDWEKRYLLLRMAEVFSEDEHLNRYIREYTNVYHRAPKSPGTHTMFGELLDLLTLELIMSEKENDMSAATKLRNLAEMMAVLSNMDF